MLDNIRHYKAELAKPSVIAKSELDPDDNAAAALKWVQDVHKKRLLYFLTLLKDHGVVYLQHGTQELQRLKSELLPIAGGGKNGKLWHDGKLTVENCMIQAKSTLLKADGATIG